MHSDVHLSMKKGLEENLKAVDNKCSLQAKYLHSSKSKLLNLSN